MNDIGNRAVLAVMEGLSDNGWCVVLKCLPKEVGWVVEGSRSEYDAPCADKSIGAGMWCLTIQDMRWGIVPNAPMRHNETVLAESPSEAVTKMLQLLESLKAK